MLIAVSRASVSNPRKLFWGSTVELYQYIYILPLCANIVPSSGHVFFYCPRFCVERGSLNRQLVCEVRLYNIMDIMLISDNQWVLVAKFR